MPDTLSSLEAAEKLEWNVEHMFCNENLDDDESADACNLAASYLRAIAAGEYKRVVHAHVIGEGWTCWCSACKEVVHIGDEYCSHCGALFDGRSDIHAYTGGIQTGRKGDSHETD